MVPNVQAQGHGAASSRSVPWRAVLGGTWGRRCRCGSGNVQLPRPVQGTELVTIRVAHIRQVHGAQLARTKTGRIFNRRSTVRDCRVMKEAHLLFSTALETDGAAIRGRSGFSIDRLADTEGSTVVPVEQAGLPCFVLISHRLSGPERAQHCIVEAL
jgi:hypothetical protein